MSELNELLNSFSRIVFLTGAGVSTASGIPDYRSKNGLYSDGQTPEYLLSATCLRKEPERHYQFVKEKMFYPQAKPNVIHEKMALFAKEKNACVITQNVDGLHSKAGTPQNDLVEFHGSLYRVFCQKCGQNVEWSKYLEDMHHEGCGGILRTDIVLYEEPIRRKVLKRAVEIVSNADLIVVCGTSLAVYPFAGLIEYASKDAKIVAVNKEKIPLPENAELIIGDAKEVFEEVDLKK